MIKLRCGTDNLLVSQTTEVRWLKKEYQNIRRKIRCPISDVKCKISYVRYQISDIICHMSDVRCLMSDGIYKLSVVRCTMLSNVRCPISYVRYHIFSEDVRSDT